MPFGGEKRERGWGKEWVGGRKKEVERDRA